MRLPGGPAGGQTADAAAPTREELGNATYQGVEEAGGPVTLVNGRWVAKPYVEGGASRPSVTLTRDFLLAGDLDGDRREEAVALLVATTGGTGETVYLAWQPQRPRPRQPRHGFGGRPRAGP